MEKYVASIALYSHDFLDGRWKEDLTPRNVRELRFDAENDEHAKVIAEKRKEGLIKEYRESPTLLEGRAVVKSIRKVSRDISNRKA